MEVTKFVSKNGLEVEFEVDSKNLFGTQRWLDKFLENSSFVIKDNGDGTPAMFLRYNYSGRSGYKFICERFNPEKNYFGYRTDSDKYAFAYPCKEGPGQGQALFTQPLQPSVKTRVNELIMKALEAYKEWYEQ